MAHACPYGACPVVPTNVPTESDAARTNLGFKYLGSAPVAGSATTQQHCFELTTEAKHSGSPCDPANSLCCTTPPANAKSATKVVTVQEVVLCPAGDERLSIDMFYTSIHLQAARAIENV